jgi:hypothetical protein
MNIQTESNNKRLLEALDHVDIKYVVELVDGLRLPKPEDGRKGIRTFRHAKQLALIAACALLLGAAIPTVQYVLPMVNAVLGGNAGAGGDEFDSPYKRTIDAYPEDMSAEEIYEDVLKGGWVVVRDREGKDIISVELWMDFLDKVNQGRRASVLIAYYSDTPLLQKITISDNLTDSTIYGSFFDDGAMILLTKIEYNGKKYTYSAKGYNPRYECEPTRFSYLNTEVSKDGKCTSYYLSNSSDKNPHPNSYAMEWKYLFFDGIISIWIDELLTE